jgi:hypothetical protein
MEKLCYRCLWSGVEEERRVGRRKVENTVGRKHMPIECCNGKRVPVPNMQRVERASLGTSNGKYGAHTAGEARRPLLRNRCNCWFASHVIYPSMHVCLQYFLICVFLKTGISRSIRLKLRPVVLRSLSFVPPSSVLAFHVYKSPSYVIPH